MSWWRKKDATQTESPEIYKRFCQEIRELELDKQRLSDFAGVVYQLGRGLHIIRSNSGGSIPDDRATKREIVDLLVILSERADHVTNPAECSEPNCRHCIEWDTEEQLNLYGSMPHTILVLGPWGEDRVLDVWLDDGRHCAESKSHPGYIGKGDDLHSAVKHLWVLLEDYGLLCEKGASI